LTLDAPVLSSSDGARISGIQPPEFPEPTSGPEVRDHDPEPPVGLGESHPSRSGALQNLQLVP
jgi:hypothetical protein